MCYIYGSLCGTPLSLCFYGSLINSNPTSWHFYPRKGVKTMLEPFLVRLLIGALVIWLTEYVLGILTLDAKIKQLLTVIVVIFVIIFILVGGSPLR